MQRRAGAQILGRLVLLSLLAQLIILSADELTRCTYSDTVQLRLVDTSGHYDLYSIEFYWRGTAQPMKIYVGSFDEVRITPPILSPTHIYLLYQAKYIHWLCYQVFLRNFAHFANVNVSARTPPARSNISPNFACDTGGPLHSIVLGEH